jgi:hypothetical protein
MKGNTWFRLYNDVINDPKVQLLPKALRWAWIEMLCLASKNDGVLPPVEQIAFAVRSSVNDTQSDLDELILAGLIDIAPDGRLTPHNWSERQFVSDNSTERSRKHRENKKKREGNGNATLHATPPDQTRPESDTDSEPDPREREQVKVNFDLLGHGRGGSVSLDARRKVCAQLAIGDAGPLVALYEAWDGSKTAHTPDALFQKIAPNFYRDASPEVRAACLPLPDRDPVAPVQHAQASSQLATKLKQEKRHGVRSY